MVEVGMAVQKVYNKGSRLGIIRYILHPYCFSLQYHYLKCSRDVRCTLLSLADYPCLYTAIPTSTINFIQLLFMLEYM